MGHLGSVGSDIEDVVIAPSGKNGNRNGSDATQSSSFHNL